MGKLVLPEQALVCGEFKAGETFSPGIRIHRRAGSDGKDVAVTLTYGGALYWYALPRNLEDIASIFVDRSMIEQPLDLSWTVSFHTEESVVAAHHATITLVSEST